MANWEIEPDSAALDHAMESPAAQRLAGSFVRSQDASNAGGAVALRRAGAAVTVYATAAPSHDEPTTLEHIGTKSYVAVPVRVDEQAPADTVQLEPSPPYRPRAMATGVEETSTARPPDARLLLDYPTHTWFAWTRTHVTVLSSGALPALAGKVFDAAGFRDWLRTR